VCIGDRYRIGQALFEVTRTAGLVSISVFWRKARSRPATRLYRSRQAQSI
jgi:hypothetical protein